MNITNKLNLPQALVNMAQQSNLESSENTYRVTSLLKGTKELILEKRHSDEITVDVSEMIWLLFGTAVHHLLNSHMEGENQFKEERITIPFNDYFITGQFDLFDAATKTISDYKTASVWKIIYGNYKDWRWQLLLYAYCLKAIGFDVETGEIIALLKDHSKRDAKFKPEYPNLQVSKIQFQFTKDDIAECEIWLENKFAEITKALKLTDDEIPICTPEERYNSGDKFAVMKRGRKTAMRVLNTKEEAEQYLCETGGDFIQTRPGEDKKCMEYCSVCDYCNHYKKIKGIEYEELKKLYFNLQKEGE